MDGFGKVFQRRNNVHEILNHSIDDSILNLILQLVQFLRQQSVEQNWKNNFMTFLPRKYNNSIIFANWSVVYFT